MMPLENKAPTSPNRWSYQNTQQHYKLKLPPFAKRLIERQDNGKPITNDIFIFIGGYRAYLKAKAFWYSGNVALTYHPDDQPSEFLWPVKNQSVLLCDSLSTGLPMQQIKQLALVLLNQGAVVVRYINLEGELLQFIGGGYVNTAH